MLQLNKNSYNNIFLTLQCNSNLWNNSGITPFYLFEFKNLSTNQKLYFSPIDIAPLSCQTRYNEFLIIETGTTITSLTGTPIYINLNPSYEWAYNVYDTVYSATTNISLATSKIASGLLMISGYTIGNAYQPNTSLTGTYYAGYSNP